MGISRRSRKRSRKNAEKLLFVIYFGTMFWLLFIERMGSINSTGNINLIPLETVKLYLHLLQQGSSNLVKHAFVNLAGNVIMFIPLGWFIPRIWRSFRAFWKVFLTVLLMIILVEILQYFTGLGSCDVDDIILNVPGAMLGYVLWKYTKHRT